MEDRALDKTLERLLQQDFSAGTEAFRDELLSRCLAVLGADDGVGVVDDNLLDMLAAAGDVYRDPNELPNFGENPASGPRP